MQQFILTAITGLVLGACASAPPSAPEPAEVAAVETAVPVKPVEETAPTPEPEPAEPMTVFSDLADGGAIHTLSQMECPASLSGFKFLETVIFAEDGSDVACQYSDEVNGQYLTVYATSFGDRFDAVEHADAAADDIMKRWPEAVFKEDASSTCSIAIDLRTALGNMIKADAAGEDSTNEVGTTPCYFFDLPSGTTAVAVAVEMPWHLKVRLTGPAGADQMSEMQDRVANILAGMKLDVSGEENADLEEMLDELGEASDAFRAAQPDA